MQSRAPSESQVCSFATGLLTHCYEFPTDRNSTGTSLSLNGFIVTRPYASERVGLFLERAMMNIWCVHSYETSISAFQSSARFQGRNPTPTAWTITQSNSYDMIVKPLCKRLCEMGVRINLDTEVVGVSVAEDIGNSKVTTIALTQGSLNNGPVMIEQVENLILAVPLFNLAPLLNVPAEMAKEIQERDYLLRYNSEPRIDPVSQGRSKQLGGRATVDPWEALSVDQAAHDIYASCEINHRQITGRIDDLLYASDAKGAALAMLYVPFYRELPDIPPRGYVGLTGSVGSLTFINVPYLAEQLGTGMVLAIAISNFQIGLEQVVELGLADICGVNDPVIAGMVRSVMREVHRYLPFDWENVVFEKIVVKTNMKHKLFLNTVGTRLVAPKIHDRRIGNLFFAVQTKENPIEIATVEGAVFGGLQAAQALWCHDPVSRNNTVKPIGPVMPRQYNMTTLLLIKLVLTPWAIAAKFLTDAKDIVPGLTLPVLPELSNVALTPVSDAAIALIEVFDRPPLRPWRRESDLERKIATAMSVWVNATLDLATGPWWYGGQAVGALAMIARPSPSGSKAYIDRHTRPLQRQQRADRNLDPGRR
jgi:hypothetical protein